MEENAWIWILKLLGRLHPLAVHFPIGLLVVALFLETLTLNKKRPDLRQGINWMVYLGAFFAALSAVLGWLLRTYDDYSGELLQDHQNLGIATAVLAAITALVLHRTMTGRLDTYWPYRSVLILSVTALTITGHLGASLTHGEDYLTSVLPGNSEDYDDGKGVALLAQLSQLDTVSETQLDDLNLEVRAIFAHNCYQCHSENKQKGELVLENKRGVFKGGKSGEVIVPGNPEKSELYRRISLSPNDDDVMPKKGKVLKKNEIALIKLWIKKGAHWSDRALKIFPEAELALSKPTLPEETGEAHPVDKFIAVYFKKKGVEWPESVDDKTFLRRAYLDIVGLLPPPEVNDRFVNDTDPNKRDKLIDTLLGDNQNYTQNWLSFWNDLLRNDYSGTGFITGGRKQITDWLYNSLLANKPYNVMIKELINPSLESEGFIKGIKWRGLVNASQRTEMQAAQNIGQSLMGVNVKCASCHNSFVSNLTLEQTYGFASIFADSVMELNRCDIPLGKMAEVNFLYPELGSVDADNVQERLWQLSEIIAKPENGRLYRTITNRIWQRLMGRGLIEPVDTMDNPPWDGDLLDWLAADLIDSNYDLKQLIQTIMTSKTYQLPTVNYENLEEIKSAKYVFKGPIIRRMSAEQFSDAVSQIISPMYYAVAYAPAGETLSPNRIWHREIKFDRDVLPEPGKRYFRHTFSLADKEIIQAKALISVDHSYVLYLNGQQVATGTDWKKVDKVDVGKFLKSGKNIIALEGTNEGNIANPAGVLFALKIDQKDSLQTIVQSANEKGWKSTDADPSNDWTRLEFDDKQWKNAKDFGSKDWDMLLDFTFDDNVPPFARASLVRQHPFMKALGRPSRENVTTTRDDQATLLQAMELTNGSYFNHVLEEGATQWLKEYNDNGETIVETLYAKSLGRKPTSKERDIMLGALGNIPTKEGLQDLFWATLLSPEFQFIY